MMLASQHYGSTYSHSPPAGFLADYTALPFPGGITTAPSQRQMHRGSSAPCLPTLKPVLVTLAESAQRSCLKAQSARPKKVVFADDRGLQLEQVRVMTEPSHVPPYWTLRVLSKSQRAEKPKELPLADAWELRFNQPNADYVSFRSRVSESNVALERVQLKEEQSILEGTVKVNNLDYAKEVFIRSSADGWRTSEDTYCAYQDTGPGGTYDTFAFRIQLPVQSRHLEFCVGYRCAGMEYWDNNCNKNYVIEKRSASGAGAPFCGAVHSGNSWQIPQSGHTPYW